MSILPLPWLTIAQHVFQPVLTGWLELISLKIVSCKREQRLLRWSDFAKNCLPRIGYKELPRFSEKHHALGCKTRRSENDNTPQPLDQWTNRSFIDQQVGNCKSFTLTHYLADLFAVHCGPSSIPLCIQHHIQLTSLSFQVSRPSHSWVTAISIFYLENPRSRSWVRSKFEVTMWVWHFIDSHPFRSMSIGHPVPEIRLFQNLTLKIHGQGYGRGEHWKSQHGSNILSTHIPFVPCQSAIPFIR